MVKGKKKVISKGTRDKIKKWMNKNMVSGMALDTDERLLDKLRAIQQRNPEAVYDGIPVGYFIRVVEAKERFLSNKPKIKDSGENGNG